MNKKETVRTSRWHILAAAFLLLPLVIFCARTGLADASKTTAGNVLHIYTWAGYLPQAILERFTAETGIRTELSFYTGSENLRGSLASSNSGAYDIVLPLEHYIPQMSAAGLLLPLERAKLPSLSNIMPRFTAPEHATLYSVPLSWGILGVAINNSYVNVNDIPGWDALWDQRFKGQVLLAGDLQTNLSMALLKLGYAPGEQNPAKVREAMNLLTALVPNASGFTTVDAYECMQKRSTRLALTTSSAWASGDGAQGHRAAASFTDPALPYTFIIPEGKSMLLLTSLAIPKTLSNKQGAYRFIEFMLRPDVAAQFSELTGLATANQAALSFVPESLRNNQTVYLPEELMRRTAIAQALPAEMLLELGLEWDGLIREIPDCSDWNISPANLVSPK